MPVESHLQRVEELKLDQSEAVSVAFALGELRLLVVEVDLLTVHCNRTDLRRELDGYDEKLMGMLQRVRKTAQEAEYSSEELALIGRHVQARVEALTVLNKDNGNTLRQVVAETSYEFKEKAKALIEKLEKGHTQGRKSEARTKRFYEHAKTFYAESKVKRSWEEAAHACLDYLIGQGISLDKIDREIRDEMTLIGTKESGNTMRNCYHNYKRKL